MTVPLHHNQTGAPSAACAFVGRCASEPLETASVSIIRRFLEWNLRLSDRLCVLTEQRTGRRCGLASFRSLVLPGLLAPGLRVLDVGGGKWPLVSPELKAYFGLHITGLDISAGELALAPPGSYDETIVGDVATVELSQKYDLIVSQTVLEHVRDTAAAIANLSRALAPGGTMAHSLPCANAGYTLVSRLLGNRLGARLLWTIYPESRATSGFPAYYRHCTPAGMRGLCRSAGLEVADVTPYYSSEYFRFCFPLYATELLRQLTLQRLRAESLCEAFTIIARKPADSAVSSRAA